MNKYTINFVYKFRGNYEDFFVKINPKNPEKLPTVQKLWHLKPKLRFLQWLRVLWKVVKDLFFRDIWPQVNCMKYTKPGYLHLFVLCRKMQYVFISKYFLFNKYVFVVHQKDTLRR